MGLFGGARSHSSPPAVIRRPHVDLAPGKFFLPCLPPVTLLSTKVTKSESTGNFLYEIDFT